ncbi:MAG TPA: phosphoheptose isomerase [candidate division Zixibacteria bacterium]|nr:phosphoheptose isomerase [candidate division Zixibacteria bacterium]
MKKALSDSAKIKMVMADTMAERIGEVVEALAATIRSGGKAIFCGNGGSAADSQHLATELVVRLSGNNNRKALPALALTTNSSILTACANDFGFDEIFARQIEALGAPGDILFAISTSGNSENVIRATKAAKRIGLVTVGFLGCGGGKLASLVDHALVIPSDDTQRVQEGHIAMGHIIIANMEQILGLGSAR